jgi:hypothetical protein
VSCAASPSGPAERPRRSLSGSVLFGRRDGADRADMGEHGEALPLDDPPQQAGERAVGLGGADVGAQDRGRGLDSRVGHNIRCCGFHSLRPLQRIHAAPRLGLPCLSRLREPDRVIAQVLEFGDFDSVLRRAQPGWFSPPPGPTGTSSWVCPPPARCRPCPSGGSNVDHWP